LAVTVVIGLLDRRLILKKKEIAIPVTVPKTMEPTPKGDQRKL
jgi:hypothetical protein